MAHESYALFRFVLPECPARPGRHDSNDWHRSRPANERRNGTRPVWFFFTRVPRPGVTDTDRSSVQRTGYLYILVGRLSLRRGFFIQTGPAVIPATVPTARIQRPGCERSLVGTVAGTREIPGRSPARNTGTDTDSRCRVTTHSGRPGLTPESGDGMAMIENARKLQEGMGVMGHSNGGFRPDPDPWTASCTRPRAKSQSAFRNSPG